jgi:hypothetical protein
MNEIEGYKSEMMGYVKRENRAIAEITLNIIITMAERDQIRKSLEEIK